jgi:large subunit ribosomal protein L2
VAIVTRKPRNSSLRFQQYVSCNDLTKKDPEKGLLAPLNKTGGRNAYGRITVRHRGGGAKRQYRLVDFKHKHKDVAGIVKAFEYDPNRNLPIALICYKNGAKSYVLKPEKISLGGEILASEKAEAKNGNSLPLRNVPTGFFVHNVELYPGQGGKFARSAGCSVQVVAKENGKATLKMPSGEVRTVCWDNWATIGVLSNADYRNLSLGKAGRSRHLGFRPSVRGMAMNPVDHPHGGGEGRSKSGSHPVTPWGKCCKGARTRKRKSSAILKRRK